MLFDSPPASAANEFTSCVSGYAAADEASDLLGAQISVRDFTELGFHKLTTPTDGHCLFHAIILSAEHQTRVPPSYLDLISKTRKAYGTHKEDFASSFYEHENPSYLMKRYINDRQYNNSFGDIAVNLISIALEATIIIYDEKDSLIRKQVIHPSLESISYASKFTLRIHRRNSHFSGICLS